MSNQQDAFDPNLRSGKFTLSKNNSVITKTVTGSDAAYLTNIAKSGVYQWRFKLLKSSRRGSPVIGIGRASKPSCRYNSFYDDFNKQKAYGYNITDGCIRNGDITACNRYNSNYKDFGKRCIDGDTIEMTLDLNKRELRYTVNNTDYGAAFKNIEKTSITSYKAVVSIYWEKISIQLISYTHIAANNDIYNNIKFVAHVKHSHSHYFLNNDNNMDDIKCDECGKQKEKNKELGRENEEIRSEMTMKTGIINSLQEEIERVKQEKVELQQEYATINESNIEINEECKELKIQLKQMTEKYNKLFRKSNMNENNYMNWNRDIIADWIINLDAQYEAYENALRTNLKKEDVDGSILSELDKGDLHRFGIISLKHKLAILKHIKRLRNQRNQQLPQNNEGNNATAYI